MAELLVGLAFYVAGILTGTLGTLFITSTEADKPAPAQLEFCANDRPMVLPGDDAAAWKALPQDIKRRVLDHDRRIDAHCTEKVKP